jgi:hypothetical protein
LLYLFDKKQCVRFGINYLKIFENTEDDFEGVRFAVVVVTGGRLTVVDAELIVDNEPDLTEDESGVPVDVGDSGLISFVACCTSVAGMGGGNGI